MLHDEITKQPETAASGTRFANPKKSTTKQSHPRAMMFNSRKSSAFRKSPEESEIRNAKCTRSLMDAKKRLRWAVTEHLWNVFLRQQKKTIHNVEREIMRAV